MWSNYKTSKMSKNNVGNIQKKKDEEFCYQILWEHIEFEITKEQEGPVI